MSYDALGAGQSGVLRGPEVRPTADAPVGATGVPEERKLKQLTPSRWAIAAVLVLVAALSMLLDRNLRPSAPHAQHSAPVADPDTVQGDRAERRPLPRRDRPRAPHEATPSTPPVPALPDAAPSAEHSLEVVGRTLDWDGRPVQGAVVATFAQDGGEIARGVSDESGKFELPDSAATATTICARCRGYETRTVPLQRSSTGVPTTRVVIQLGRAAPVTGRVRLPDGSVPPERIRVMVRLPADTIPGGWAPLDCAQAAVRSDLRIATAVTDSVGNFEIDGMPAGSWCWLLAAGPGLAALQPSTSVVEAQAGGAPVDIVVAPLYVLDVRVRGPDGLPPRVSSKLRPHLPGFVHWTDPFPSKVPYTPWHAELEWAGIEGLDRHDAFRTSVAYTADTRADRVGPFHTTVTVPGYRAASIDLWAIRATGGASATQEIRLESSGSGFGTLQVTLDDSGVRLGTLLRETARNTEWFNAPKLVLRPQADRQFPPLCLALSDVGAGRIEVDDVPAGRYRGSLDLQLGSPLPPGASLDIEVLPSKTAEVAVRVPEWAAIEVVPVQGSNPERPYACALSLTLRRSGSGGSDSWRFSGPPYRAAGMMPGTYEATLSGVRMTSQTFTVELPADRVTRVEHRVEISTGTLNSR